MVQKYYQGKVNCHYEKVNCHNEKVKCHHGNIKMSRCSHKIIYWFYVFWIFPLLLEMFCNNHQTFIIENEMPGDCYIGPDRAKPLSFLQYIVIEFLITKDYCLSMKKMLSYVLSTSHSLISNCTDQLQTDFRKSWLAPISWNTHHSCLVSAPSWSQLFLSPHRQQIKAGCHFDINNT